MRVRRLFTIVIGVCLLGSASNAGAQDAATQSVVLRMADGSFIVGQIVSEDGGKITINAGTLGTLTIDAAQVADRLEPARFAGALAQITPQPAPTGGAVPAFAQTPRAVWSRTISIGGSFTSAPFKQGPLLEGVPQLTGAALSLIGEQSAVQGSVQITRATLNGAFFAEANQIYANTEPLGNVANTLSLSTGYNFRLNKDGRLYALTRYTYRHDKVREIDFSNVGLVGVGYTVVGTPKVKFDLVPGLAIIYEEKGTAFDNDVLFGLGFIESLTVQPHPMFTLEQREMYYLAPEDSEFWGLESYLGIRGMLSKYFGITFGLSHLHDNVLETRPTVIPANALFPGQPQFNVLANEASQLYITAGVLVRW